MQNRILAKAAQASIMLVSLLCLQSCDSEPAAPGSWYSCNCNCLMKAKVATFFGQDVFYKGEFHVKDNLAFACGDTIDTAKAVCPAACNAYSLPIWSKGITWLTSPADAQAMCTLAEPPTLVTAKKNACVAATYSALRAGLPEHATLEGPIDWGLSYLDIAVPSQNDDVRVKLKGKISMVGGNCTGGQCPLEIWYVDVQPLDGGVTTRQGHSLTDMTVVNEGILPGVKYPDGHFELAPSSVLTVSADVDGKRTIAAINPSAYFKGRVEPPKIRLKSAGSASSGSIRVDGDAVDGIWHFRLHLLAWITNCQPEIKASATCSAIDQNDRGTLWLKAEKMSLLGDAQNQDLCTAMLVSDPTTVCKAGGDNLSEFATFSCLDKAPAGSPGATGGQNLKLLWRDQTGTELGNPLAQNPLPLDHLPPFPITLSAENEWGRGAKDVIEQAPAGHCPPAEAMKMTVPNKKQLQKKLPAKKKL